MPKPPEEIVAEMEPELLNRAMHELPPALALDVVQDTIVAAIKVIEDGDMQDWDEARFKNYTFGIYKHKRDDALRSARRDPSVVDSGSRTVDPGRTPSSAAVLNERSDRLNLALEKLNERERNIITWRYQDNLKYREIGLKLGISLQAAEQAFVKAVEKLKKYYGPDTSLT